MSTCAGDTLEILYMDVLDSIAIVEGILVVAGYGEGGEEMSLVVAQRMLLKHQA